MVPRETPTLGGAGWCGQRAWRQVGPAGDQLGQNRPLACSRIRVSSRLRSPRPHRVTGALSHAASGSGMTEGGRAEGSRCAAVTRPGLGPISIIGCLSDPGPVTLTSPGLSLLNHKVETAPTLLAGPVRHSYYVTAPGVIQVFTLTPQPHVPSTIPVYLSHHSYVWHQQGILHISTPRFPKTISLSLLC